MKSVEVSQATILIDMSLWRSSSLSNNRSLYWQGVISPFLFSVFFSFFIFFYQWKDELQKTSSASHPHKLSRRLALAARKRDTGAGCKQRNASANRVPEKPDGFSWETLLVNTAERKFRAMLPLPLCLTFSKRQLMLNLFIENLFVLRQN